MAVVRINQFEMRVADVRFGEEFLRKVLHDVRSEAMMRTLFGPYSTGALAASIRTEGPDVVGQTVSGRVGTDMPYAASVHNGAKVHSIWAGGVKLWRPGDRGRPQLKFFWRKKGRIAYFPHIPGGPGSVGRSHPGQKGQKFLTIPLERAAAKYGMYIIVTNP